MNYADFTNWINTNLGYILVGAVVLVIAFFEIKKRVVKKKIEVEPPKPLATKNKAVEDITFFGDIDIDDGFDYTANISSMRNQLSTLTEKFNNNKKRISEMMEENTRLSKKYSIIQKQITLLNQIEEIDGGEK